MKTSELIGPALDWAVAVCENVEPDENNKPIWFGDGDERVEYTPSTDWSQGGLIIEQERIAIDGDDGDYWNASIKGQRNYYTGPTPPRRSHALLRCLKAGGRS